MIKSNKTCTNHQNNVLHIPVADIICRLKSDDISYIRYFRKAYYSLPSPSLPSFTIVLKRQSINTLVIETDPNFLKILIFFSRRPLFAELNLIIKAIIEYYVIFQNILLLHGSSFCKNGLGYIFLGPVGSGKSTIIQKIKQDQILSDDTVVIKRENGKFYIFTSPFDNRKYPNLSQKKVPLSKIFLIKKSNITKLAKIKIIDCFENILYNDIYTQFVSFSNSKIDSSLYRDRLKDIIIESGSWKRQQRKFKAYFYSLILNLLSFSKPEVLFFTKKVKFLSWL